MSVSWTQTATGALLAVVVAGLLLLPARVLAPGATAVDAVPLPHTVTPAPVVAAALPQQQPKPQRAVRRATPGQATAARATAHLAVAPVATPRPAVTPSPRAAT